MCSIMGQIEPEHPELFALEIRKIAESDFVYTLYFSLVNVTPPQFIYWDLYETWTMSLL